MVAAKGCREEAAAMARVAAVAVRDLAVVALRVAVECPVGEMVVRVAVVDLARRAIVPEMEIVEVVLGQWLVGPEVRRELAVRMESRVIPGQRIVSVCQEAR